MTNTNGRKGKTLDYKYRMLPKWSTEIVLRIDPPQDVISQDTSLGIPNLSQNITKI